MKTNQLPKIFGTLFFGVALALLGFGCATQEQHSFNADYNQQLTTAPNYYIEDVNAKCFIVTAARLPAISFKKTCA